VVIHRVYRWAAVALGCGCAARERATSSVEHAWRQGPRDSALATAMACTLLRSIDLDERRCVVVGYRETPAEYVLRLQVADRTVAAAHGTRLEVRLTRDGDSATVEQLAVP